MAKILARPQMPLDLFDNIKLSRHILSSEGGTGHALFDSSWNVEHRLPNKRCAGTWRRSGSGRMP
jgi:hypothetical protein